MCRACRRYRRRLRQDRRATAASHRASVRSRQPRQPRFLPRIRPLSPPAPRAVRRRRPRPESPSHSLAVPALGRRRKAVSLTEFNVEQDAATVQAEQERNPDRRAAEPSRPLRASAAALAAPVAFVLGIGAIPVPGLHPVGLVAGSGAETRTRPALSDSLARVRGVQVSHTATRPPGPVPPLSRQFACSCLHDGAINGFVSHRQPVVRFHADRLSPPPVVSDPLLRGLGTA